MNDNILDRAEEEVDMESEKTSQKIPVTTRLQLLERDARNHSRMISSIIQTLREHGKSLQEIEEWQLKMMLDHVRGEEQQKALLLRLEQMTTTFNDGIKSVKSDIASVRGVGTRIMWIAGSPVIAAVVLAILVLTFGRGVPVP